MDSLVSLDRFRFLINQLRQRLWVRPLVVCLLSIGAAFIAKLADNIEVAQFVPTIEPDSIETLLSIMASSMLVIATFSVASMVSAYASASSTVTPRSFSLVLADDVSQNALSTFVGAFIFSIVALMAVKNGYFEKSGLFVLFSQTALVFSIIIFTFVRWVDSIARLGRLGSTIDKVEKATADAMNRRRVAPTLHGMAEDVSQARGQPVFAETIGYVQHIDMSAIQEWAEEEGARVVIATLPGTLAVPDHPLAYVSNLNGDRSETDYTCVVESFEIGNERLFEDDPRFGLVVLSEIAGRALSPAVNDPGTAINIIGVLLRLFSTWNDPPKGDIEEACTFDRVEVPLISVRDMFDDAFTAIARDGAGAVEIGVRLQKALSTLASIGDSEIREAAIYHKQLALKRARKALDMDEDLAVVRDAGNYKDATTSSDNASSNKRSTT